jgi:hypothetical protein
MKEPTPDTYCPNKEYEKIYTDNWNMRCPYCDIPMSQCIYWQARQKDKFPKQDSWKGCLLDSGIK